MPATESGNGHRALRKGRISVANGIYLVTTATENRLRWFSEFTAGCEAVRCFEDARLLGDARMLAWVLMPDHVHWLLQPGEREALSRIVNRLKSASARQTNRVLHRSGAIWAKAYHDHALRKDEDIQHAARYVVANPLRAGLVSHIGDYPFWNAIWL